MSYSIRFSLPSPPEGSPANAASRLLFAIRVLVVERFDGSMHVTNTTLPPRNGEPACPGFQVTLDFEDSVSPLAVTRALDELHDNVAAIVSTITSSE